MTKSKTNSKVDKFLSTAKTWQEEFEQLRTILLDCDLTEEFKWGKPCYTFEGNNIVLMHGFKNYCALLFHKGVLLDDKANILIQQTKNTQSARQIRFTSADEIVEMEHIIKAYVNEAIEVEKAGLEVDFKDTSEFEFPEEFQSKLEDNPELEKAFEALTPGRQRGYLLYFSGAKQSKTREARVERYVQHILDGKGLNDE